MLLILLSYDVGAVLCLCSATEESRLFWTTQGAQVCPRNQEAKHELSVMVALQLHPQGTFCPQCLEVDWGALSSLVTPLHATATSEGEVRQLP